MIAARINLSPFSIFCKISLKSWNSRVFLASIEERRAWLPIAPGEYTLKMRIYIVQDDETPDAEWETDLYVVRLGIEQIQFTDNVSLQYPFRSVADWETNTPGISGLGERYAIPSTTWRMGADDPATQGDTNLDVTETGDDLGKARPAPDPRGEHSTTSSEQDVIDELYWPPSEEGTTTVEDDTYNFPVCYVFSTTPQLAFTVGQRAVSQVESRVLAAGEMGYQTPCEYAINIEEIASQFDGKGDVTFTAAAGSSFTDISPGATISVEASDTMAQSVGKETIEITYTFSYAVDGEDFEIPGYYKTRHTIYRVADTPKAPQAVPWVRVLDEAVEWAEGATSVLVVHTMMESSLNGASGWKAGQEMRLRYDITTGAPNYTIGFNPPTVNLANFMMFLHPMRNTDVSVLVTQPNPKTENTINCLDCSALLTCFANAVGGNLTSSFLGGTGGFRLNPISPIGWDSWESIGLLIDGAFGYHAVATPAGLLNDDTRIHDSCLMLGRPDPAQFVNGAEVQPGTSRFSDGSVFDAPDSLSFTLTGHPGAGDLPPGNRSRF